MEWIGWIVPFALGLAPGLVWLFFFMQEDDHPEPKKAIALVFLFGVISAFIALAFQMGLHDTLEGITLTIPRMIEENLSVFLGFAIIEEVLKFLFVFLAIRKSKDFDEPIDAMIYMMTGALAFATVENMFLVFSTTGVPPFMLIVLRFVGATLLHALGAGVIGHYWARGIRLKMEAKFVFAGLVMASLLHAAFNYLVTKYNDVILYPTVFLGIVGFFVLYDFEDLKGESFDNKKEDVKEITG